MRRDRPGSAPEPPRIAAPREAGSVAPGIYVAHKPVGATSRSIVEAMRGGSRHAMIHGGALDPFAEGCLPVLVGDATRVFDALHGVPKVYLAEVAWGVETDTGDPGGVVLAEGEPSRLDERSLAAALAGHLGWRDQVPPPTSNKRVDGERAWVRAHRGEVVELPPSRVYLHQAAWTAHALPARSTLRLVVGGGYYVRSLVRDLGRELGARAHLTALRRLAVGPWSDPGPDAAPARLQGEGLLPWMPLRRLTPAERAAVAPGVAFPLGEPRPATWPLPDGFPAPPVRLGFEGRLVGLAAAAGTELGVTVGLGRGL